MDEFTRMRYPFELPTQELHARPTSLRPAPVTADQVSEHRIGLCGTDNLDDQVHGGEPPARRRLGALLRRWRR